MIPMEHDFNLEQAAILRQQALAKKLARSKRKVELLEKLIEDKSREAFKANDQLVRSNQSLETLYQALPSAMLVVNSDGLIVRCNRSAQELLKYSYEQLLNKPALEICKKIDKIVKLQLAVNSNYQEEQEWQMENGSYLPVLVSASVLDDTDVFDCSYVFIASDLRERKQMELELRHSQKLESIGQLAAGVAHEINTPMQYIGDNAYFIRDSIADLLKLLAHMQNMVMTQQILSGEQLKVIQDLEEEIDLEYLIERLPKAADRTLYGVERVTKIVSAMKAFSHPSMEKSPADINAAIETTLTIAKSEYKYVAKVKTEFGQLPQVVCNIGDINQVILNLVINASHAIADRKFEDLGRIGIKTYVQGKYIVIAIKDNGKGIPLSVRSRIFEPFFTTKEVGKGTGQGLAMAYVVIVEKHGGKIYFETIDGEGTTFFIHLPIE